MQTSNIWQYIEDNEEEWNRQREKKIEAANRELEEWNKLKRFEKIKILQAKWRKEKESPTKKEAEKIEIRDIETTWNTWRKDRDQTEVENPAIVATPTEHTEEEKIENIVPVIPKINRPKVPEITPDSIPIIPPEVTLKILPTDPTKIPPEIPPETEPDYSSQSYERIAQGLPPMQIDPSEDHHHEGSLGEVTKGWGSNLTAPPLLPAQHRVRRCQLNQQGQGPNWGTTAN